MSKTYLSGIFFISFFLTTFCQAQNAALVNKTEKLVFNHPGKEIDFPNYQINCYAEDTLGFIWIATSNGLYRYDGKSFKAFKHIQGDTSTFEANSIKSILVAKSGVLWVGVDGAGLYKYDPVKEQFKQYKNPVNTISTTRIFWMKEDLKGRIWMGTYGGGLCGFDPGTELFTNYDHKENDNQSILTNSPVIMERNKDGKFWLGYLGYKGQQIDLFNPETGRVLRYTVPYKFADSYGISGLKQVSDSELICSSEKELIFYNLRSHKCKTFYHIKGDSASMASEPFGMLVLRNGKILVKSLTGCDVFDRQSETFQHFKHDPSDPFSANDNIGSFGVFFEDSKNNVWVSGKNSTLEVIYPMSVKTSSSMHKENDEKTILSDDVFTLYEGKDSALWVGYYGAGGTRVDRKTGKLQHLREKKELNNGLIYAFCEDDDSIIWLGTEDGLTKFDTKEWKTIKTYFLMRDEAGKPEISRIHRQANIIKGKGDILWLGTLGGGLIEFNKRTEKYKLYRTTQKNKDDPYSLSDNRIMDMSWDPWNNLLWLGTFNGGVNAFDPQTKKFTRFSFKNNDKNGISNNFIYHADIETTTGVLWIGTDGGGLNALDLKELKGNLKKVKFYHFTDNEGLADNNIAALAFNGDGSMWIGSGSGISLFTPPSYLGGQNNDSLYKNGIVKIFKSANGLPFEGAAANAMIRSRFDKRIYVGGVGYYSFLENEIIENKTPPKILLTEIKLFGKVVLQDSLLQMKKLLRLSYNQNSISFSFAALNFVFPDKNQFAYKLEGFDKSWTYSGNKNEASYTNLDAGEYVFHVKGSNNNSYWNNEGCSIKIIITPPFWKTKWFYALLIILSIGMVGIFIRYREKKLQKEKKLLEEKVTERTSELKHQKDLVEEKNKEITDSITYAKRLQNAILPPLEYINNFLPECFVFYSPKDIVAGDFYWFEHFDDDLFIAAADCTGHGVPGAMISVVCSNALERAVKEFGLRDTGKILDKTRALVIETFEKGGENVKDGMDISMLSINKRTKSLQWSGANNPLWLIHNGELKEIKGDKQPVGLIEDSKPFTTYGIDYIEGATYYLITDGFADQFGGEKGKKFKHKQLQKLLADNNEKAVSEQKKLMEARLEEWKGNLEQVDDITIIGIRL